jgi:pimeloyl-ACP methyl ester carboxylesterase
LIVDNRAFTAPGELVLADGSNYHVRRFGERGPTIILECGLTMMSSCWGWIAPELANFARAFAYDRAGLGWSSERDGVRGAAIIARELAGLLAAMSVNDPVVLLGHSMGAILNDAFLRRRPTSVRALIWLDPAHPEQFHRRGIRRRMRHLVFYIEAARMLANARVPAIELPLVRHLDSLPEQDFRVLRRFLRDPTHLRTCAREARAWESAPACVAGELGDIPVLMISARKNALPGWEGLQRELAGLSLSTRHLNFPETSHLSMLADRDQAKKVVAEIRSFLESHNL